MMNAKRENGTSIIAWAIGGFVISVLALFSIMGGFILAMLMVAATPFILGLLAVEAALGKRPVYVTSRTDEEVKLAVPVEEALAEIVSARAIHVEGGCPQGYTFEVGDTLSINGSVQGPHPVCPLVGHLLIGAAARLREGNVSEEEVRCVGKDHRIIFALRH